MHVVSSNTNHPILFFIGTFVFMAQFGREIIPFVQVKIGIYILIMDY